jgi:acetyltransferase-like isoleucine patch superfamily enzyme
MKKLLLRLYWRITRAWLRFHGAEIGKNVKCNGFPHIKIRKGGRLIIGNNVQINASPWANAHVARGSTNLFVAAGAVLEIEQDAGISGVRIVAIQKITIGKGVLIGGGGLICDSDMHEIPLGSDKPVRNAPIIIRERAFIGAGSIILKGVEVGESAVIGAGSVVSKSIPPHTLAAGNPAKAILQIA